MALARRLLLVLLALCVAAAVCAGGLKGAQTETLDRVILTIHGVPYTQSDLVRECRLETFLASGRVASEAPAARELAGTLPRLVDQKLLEGELGAYHFNAASIQARARRQMAELRKQSAGEADFERSLQSLGVSEQQLMERMETQQEILEMIDARLRPAASVSAGEVANYYHQTLAPQLARDGGGAPPSLAQTESKIREILIQKKINQLLDAWLMELRKEHQVEILGGAARLTPPTPQ